MRWKGHAEEHERGEVWLEAAGACVLYYIPLASSPLLSCACLFHSFCYAIICLQASEVHASAVALCPCGEETNSQTSLAFHSTQLYCIVLVLKVSQALRFVFGICIWFNCQILQIQLHASTLPLGIVSTCVWFIMRYFYPDSKTPKKTKQTFSHF